MIYQQIENKLFEEVISKQVKYLAPISSGQVNDLVKEVYTHMQQDFQLVPPMALHTAVPELLAATWTMGRETLIAGSVSRINKEVVAAAIAVINRCPFCVDAHTGLLHGATHHSIADAVLREDYDQIDDPELRTLIDWALANRTPKSVLLF